MNKTLVQYIEELKSTLITLETRIHDIQIALKVLHQINRGDFTFAEDRSTEITTPVITPSIKERPPIKIRKIYTGAPEALLDFLKREKGSYTINELSTYLGTTGIKGKNHSRRNTTQAALYRLFRRDLVSKMGKGKWAYKTNEGSN